jgi:hypothetical protein
MATTNMQQWNPTASNQETDVEYTADSQRSGGATDPSIFPSPTGNKVFYQLSTYLTALFTAFANKGFTTSDSNLSTLTAQCANFLTSADVESQFQIVTYAPTITLNLTQALGFEITLTGNISIGVSGAQPGQIVVLLLNQGNSGGYTAAFSGAIFAYGQPDPTAGAVTLYAFKVDSVGHLLPIAPVMSDANGVISTPIGTVNPTTGKFTTLSTTGLATLQSLTLAAPGSAGQVLTNVGGLFVPASPGFTSVTNANGTYRIAPDGIIECWGVITLAGTGNAHSSATWTFPHVFATGAFVQATLLGYPDNGNTSELAFATTASLTTGSVLINGMCPAVSGGGGASFSNSVQVQVYAIGR